MKDADFLAFIRSERKRLIHYVRSLLRGAADMDAEDVVHDVLTKMLERPDASAELGNLTSYVYRSVRNRVIDLGRTRKATVSLDADPDGDRGLADVLADTKPDALGLLQTEQGERALFAALDTLSEIERRVVIAHEFEGVTYRELSATLNIPLNTLLSHKSRALKKLQEHFSTVR